MRKTADNLRVDLMRLDDEEFKEISSYLLQMRLDEDKRLMLMDYLAKIEHKRDRRRKK